MFTNTAYEALYLYIGLALHSRIIDILTSMVVVKGALLFIVGLAFLHTTLGFFSRYLSGAIVAKRGTPLSAYFRLMVCVALASMLLSVRDKTDVKDYQGRSWKQNSYIKRHFPKDTGALKTSLPFDLLASSAEEISSLAARVVDRLFAMGHSQLKAPAMFYKAVMYAGSASIEDASLRDAINLYTEDCLVKILPDVASKSGQWDAFYRLNARMDRKLMAISLPRIDGDEYGAIRNCYDLKYRVRSKLYGEATAKSKSLAELWSKGDSPGNFVGRFWNNMVASAMLVEHYRGKSEDQQGLKLGAKTEGVTSSIVMYLNRALSIDGVFSLLGWHSLQGSVIAAKRAEKFSENLERAPHVAGFIKLTLIVVFPFLTFLVAAGRWRCLITWWLIYLSVGLWAPIWTLLYHIMDYLSTSLWMMEQYGRLTDGISLYSAEVIGHRIYYMYAVYSWVAVFAGPIFTVLMVYLVRPFVGDTEKERMPEFVDSAKDVARTAAPVAGAL